MELADSLAATFMASHRGDESKMSRECCICSYLEMDDPIVLLISYGVLYISKDIHLCKLMFSGKGLSRFRFKIEKPSKFDLQRESCDFD